MLECKICGRKLNQINGGHLKSHKITAEEYKKMFPGSILIPISDKHRESARKGRVKWNKTEIANQKRIARNKSPEMRQAVSNLFKDKPKSEEHKLALREAKANEDKNYRAKVNGENRKGKPLGLEAIEKAKRTLISSGRSINHPYKSGYKEDLGEYFRSGWEANFARILKRLLINYQFESKNFIIDKGNGEKTGYLPDFYLPDLDLYIEIKGRWNEESKEKFNLFKKQYPHLKIRVIDGPIYNRYAKRYKDKIKEWE